MNESDLKDMLINPYCAINLAPDMAEKHEPLVSESQWIEVNLKLIDEVGAREWLERLLAVLQGAGPLNPDELADLYVEPTEE